MRMKHCVILIAVLLSAASLSACSSLRYYSQAIAGQWKVLQAREDIAGLISNPETPDALVDQLIQAQAIRRYASDVLGLPDNDSYTQYADVQRPYVVWNVVAAPLDSLSPLRHCFPFAGCVVYRGFFQQGAAQAYADSLQQQGYEIYLYGVRAYSTLGWFDDPILNTMLNTGSELYLAGLIFHELTHQVVYVKGASEFNESFATAIEELALQQWLLDKGRTDLQQRQLRGQQRQQQFFALVRQHRERLLNIYSQPSFNQTEKKAVYTGLVSGYKSLKQEWRGYSAYDHWFESQLNNAKLAVFSTYNTQVDDIKAHYHSCGLTMPQYLKWVARAKLGSESLRRDFFLNSVQCSDVINSLD